MGQHEDEGQGLFSGMEKEGNVDEQGFDWDTMQHVSVEGTPQNEGSAEVGQQQPPESGEDQTAAEEPGPAPQFYFDAAGRLRAPDGTFASREQMQAAGYDLGDGIEEAPPEVEGPVYTPEAQEYLQRYGGDPAKAIEAAANMTALLGRQGNEIGLLRQQIQQLQQGQMQQPQQQPMMVTQEMLEENPGAVAVAAYNRQDWNTFRAAFEAWKDPDIGDPFEAAMWASDLKLQQAMQQVAGPVQHVAQNQHAQAEQAEFLSLAQKYPDLGQYEEIMNQVIEARPSLKVAIERASDPRIVAAAIEDAYWIAKAHAQDTLNGQMTGLAKAQAQAAEEVQREAFVASATSTVREPPKTAADLVTAGWDQIPSSLLWE